MKAKKKATKIKNMNDSIKNGNKTTCEDCRFKFDKSEMLEKENKDKKGESKWYCRRCALWNRG